MPDRFVIPVPDRGPFSMGPDSHRQPGVPQGTVTQNEWRSEIFPGTMRALRVYVPAQYTADHHANVNVVWGGTMLSSYLGRELPQTDVPVGESWEISDTDGAESVVSNGDLKGLKIKKLIEYYGKSLLVENFQGGRFPLLVKLQNS